jgi:Rha family phage regulatory protein
MNDSLLNTERITSIEIAEITGKLHKNVLRDIEKMEESWEKVNGLKFELVNYKDSKGEIRPCYSLTKTECLYVATKYNDEARAKLVLRWEQLEREKALSGFDVPKTFREALLLAAEQQRMIEEKDKELEVVRPKAELMDKVINTEDLVDIGQASKLLKLGFGRNTLYKLLRKMGIFFKNRNEPKQTYVKQDYFKLKEELVTGWPDRTYTRVYVTQKGLEFLGKQKYDLTILSKEDQEHYED